MVSDETHQETGRATISIPKRVDLDKSLVDVRHFCKGIDRWIREQLLHLFKIGFQLTEYIFARNHIVDSASNLVFFGGGKKGRRFKSLSKVVVLLTFIQKLVKLSAQPIPKNVMAKF